MPAHVSVRRGAGRGLLRADVRRWADRMLAELDLHEAELSVVLTDDEEIRGLNLTYRKQDKPTDVLAFAMREGPGMAAKGTVELLGDVIISVETADRQARRARRSLEAETRVLLAHGLLHLVGFDHRTPRELRRMQSRTRALCRLAEGRSLG